MSRFIKYIPDSEISKFLEKKPLTNHLALIIAKRARRSIGSNGLQIGECIISDYGAYGLTEQQYRTAKKHLEKLNFCTFRITDKVTLRITDKVTSKVTDKVTVAKLVSISVWDINENDTNGQGNGQSNGLDNGQGNDKLTMFNKKDYKNEQEEKEREEKKALSLQNSKIEDLEKQLSESNEKIKALEAEKEKEKSSAKKESGKHEFPQLNGKPKAELKTPTHAKDLEQAFYSAEDSMNLKPYELAVQNYAFENWTETLKEAFFIFCEGKYETTKRKFSGTQAKELIKAIESDYKTQGMQRVEKCLRLCALNDWTYKISYQINQEARDKEDELKRQKQQANDPNLSTVEVALRARYGDDFGEAEHQEGNNSTGLKWYEVHQQPEQEF